MTHLPILLQVLMAEVGLEFLRMAAIHTPTPLSSAAGLISAILIGQIAIDVGLFVPEVILYVAVSMIGAYATPSYELGLGNKVGKLFVIILTGLFHEMGFVIGMTILILFLTSIKVYKHLIYGVLPFDWGALTKILLRPTMSSLKVRPSIVRPQNVKTKINGIIHPFIF